MPSKSLLFALCLVAFACSSKKNDKAKTVPDRTRIPIKVTTQPPDGVEPSLWNEVAWFPADVVNITEMTHKDRMLPMIDFARNLGRSSKWPKCAFDQLDKVDHYFMATRGARKSSTLIFFGGLQRAAFEKCARAVVARPALHGSVESHGPITVLRALGKQAYLGWVNVGGQPATIYDTDQKQVDAFLGAVKRLGPKHPLARPLATVNRKGDQWVAGATDIGSQYFGVPSSGFALEMSFHGAAHKGKPVPLDVSGWIEFDVDTRAREALSRLEKALAAIGNKLPIAVLDKLKRRVEGSRLRIELSVDSGAVAKVLRWVAEAKATMRDK